MTKPKFIMQVYNLAQPWDLACATLGEKIHLERQAEPCPIAFHGKGLAVFALGDLKVSSFLLQEPWWIPSSETDASVSFSVACQFSEAETVSFSRDGHFMFVQGYEHIDGKLSAHDLYEIKKANRQITPAEYPVEPHVHYKPKRDWIKKTLYCVLAFCLFGMAFSGFKALQIALGP
jgi:hypothetical protein